MITRRIFLSALATTGFGLNAIGQATAQTYPNRAIKVIVPFPPGGPTDVMARLVADKLSSILGQSVIVESRPGGAGGTIGAKMVANADPDGYTLLLANVGTLTISPAIYKNLDYEPLKSFVPVALVASSPQVLVVNPKLAVNSLAELIAYVKSNPGTISYASPGSGTQPHLLGELLKSIAGIDILHVPYRGSAPAITDLLAGQPQMMFDTMWSLLPHIEGGKLKPLVVTNEKRTPELPAVPTVIEAGFPQLEAAVWAGIVAPAATPPAIIDKLNSAINDSLKLADTQASLKKLGTETKIGSPQNFAAFMAAETKKWAAVVKAAGIKPD